jgi:hypothetical protein
MKKIDLRKEWKENYNPSKKEVSFIKIPKMNFIMIDGQGNPNTSEGFKKGVEYLFGLSYTLKFMIKKQNIADYSVMPLEGLWWMDDMRDFTVANKDSWKWTIMIMQPEYIDKKIFEIGKKEFMGKKKIDNLDEVRFESYNEGLSAQIMYIGPYTDEEPVIKNIHSVFGAKGYEPNGKHHEIYLSDFRKTAPEKLKTVLRQPIRIKN